MPIQEILEHPMTIGAMIGLSVGLLFCFLMFISRFKVARQAKYYRNMLEERNKMEKEHMELYRKDLERLEKDQVALSETNANLRQKVSQMKSSSETIRARDVEIMARAEKRLLKASPSFGIAWEDAKNNAALELEEEEAGKRKSGSFFRRFVPSRNGTAKETANA